MLYRRAASIFQGCDQQISRCCQDTKFECQSRGFYRLSRFRCCTWYSSTSPTRHAFIAYCVKDIFTSEYKMVHWKYKLVSIITVTNLPEENKNNDENAQQMMVEMKEHVLRMVRVGRQTMIKRKLEKIVLDVIQAKGLVQRDLLIKLDSMQAPPITWGTMVAPVSCYIS